MQDGIYGLVLGYLKTLWVGVQEIVSDVSTDIVNNAVNFMGLVTSYSHVFVKGIWYGSAKHHQGKSSRYAYIHGRQAVEIQRGSGWVLEVTAISETFEVLLVAELQVTRLPGDETRVLGLLLDIGILRRGHSVKGYRRNALDL